MLNLLYIIFSLKINKVLPVAEALTTPCLTSRMRPASREKLKEKAKRYDSCNRLRCS